MRLWYGKAPEDFNEADVARFMAETEALLQKRELPGGGDGAKPIARQLAEGRAQAPVSYTHLDVYKRQTLPCATSNPKSWRCATGRGFIKSTS